MTGAPTSERTAGERRESGEASGEAATDLDGGRTVMRAWGRVGADVAPFVPPGGLKGEAALGGWPELTLLMALATLVVDTAVDILRGRMDAVLFTFAFGRSIFDGPGDGVGCARNLLGDAGRDTLALRDVGRGYSTLPIILRFWGPSITPVEHRIAERRVRD